MLGFVEEDEEKPRKRGGWGFFLWSALLMLMAGACFASWAVSFYVIGHPEEPRCHRLLKRLGKLDPPRRFDVTKAPLGKFLSPARLLEHFGKIGPAHLAEANAEMLRAYVMNYRETKTPPVYVTGRFDVTGTHALGMQDFFRSGAVAVAQAKDQPQFLLECIFSADAKTGAKIVDLLPTGSEITLERSRDVWALLHVERLADGRMQFTAVPLPYGALRIKNGDSFKLASPEELERGAPDRGLKADTTLALNIEAGLPVVKGERLAKGLQAYGAHRRKLLAEAGDDEAALVGPELVRFEPLRAPEAPRATIVQLPDQPAGDPPAAGARALPTPAPAVPLPPRPVVRLPAAIVPPPPVTPEMRAPRVVTTSEASAMVDAFDTSHRTFLTGEFVVTGVLGQRVALRAMESLRDRNADPTSPGTNAALVVVDFPDGTPPPGKNSTLTRDEKDGFAVRDVIRGRNGQITIVAGAR